MYWLKKVVRLFSFAIFIGIPTILQASSTETLKMPEPDKEGRIPTLNKTGWILPAPDAFTKEFIQFTSSITAPALEIGAGYGFATIAALKQGATVIANDIDEKHLIILKENTPLKLRNRLMLRPGAFPNITGIEKNSLGAILCVRVLHFFDAPTLEASAQKMYEILQHGGKIFVVTNSPYMKNWEKFIPVYEERKKKGEFYPGIINDIGKYNPDYVSSSPPLVHFLDPEILELVFKNAGFIIEKVEYMDRQDYPKFVRLDGRESVGLIARKP